jgi:hypothetical protein
MKKIKIIITTIIVSLSMMECSDYLDIVPDNTIKLEDIFDNSEMAYNALAKVYTFIPAYHNLYNSPYLFGDEWVGRATDSYNTSMYPPIGVMMGAQNNGSPLYDLWCGTNGAPGLYEGIRTANTFLEKINLVSDLSEKERNNWVAQVKFFKAYFHYQLILYYGPVIITDRNVNVDEPDDKIMGRRAKIDDSFNYVISLVNEAIPDLDDRASELFLGMIDKKIALAMKARILLLRASPLYNGNKEYYSKFLDFDGQPFFPQQEDPQKWQDALTAVDEAISFCESQGCGLYEFNRSSTYTPEDDKYFEQNPEVMQRLYSIKMSVADKWNKELIWGRTHAMTEGNLLQFGSAIRALNNNMDSQYTSTTNVGNYLGADYYMLERFYTKNGLPIDADLTFRQSSRYDIEQTPDTVGGKNKEWTGILQPGIETAYLYQDRELRFYADLGITGGYWRQYQMSLPIMMYSNRIGGISSIHGNTGLTNYFWSGIGVQKFVHPESRCSSPIRFVRFPYPIIRMADLYLMKAECLNEVKSQPDEEVWDEINKVRHRAGIPDVDDVWANATLTASNYLNRHKTKAGMREIILQERSIEMAFEGTRFFDVRRHKKAIAEFNKPSMGWMGDKGTAEDFFVLETKQKRRFLMRDYLWPIPLDEINVNPNLKQNPYWPGWEK